MYQMEVGSSLKQLGASPMKLRCFPMQWQTQDIGRLSKIWACHRGDNSVRMHPHDTIRHMRSLQKPVHMYQMEVGSSLKWLEALTMKLW